MVVKTNLLARLYLPRFKAEICTTLSMLVRVTTIMVIIIICTMFN